MSASPPSPAPSLTYRPRDRGMAVMHARGHARRRAERAPSVPGHLYKRVKARTAARADCGVARVRGRAGCAAAAEPASHCGVLLVDNYDSFTYNLSQYLAQLGCEHRVVKNDEISVDEIKSMSPPPLGILISPGPGEPEDSGISLEVVEAMCLSTPIFGVCMGHQCIGHAFGGNIIRSPTGLMHGKSSPIQHKGTGVLKGAQGEGSPSIRHFFFIREGPRRQRIGSEKAALIRGNSLGA